MTDPKVLEAETSAVPAEAASPSAAPTPPATPAQLRLTKPHRLIQQTLDAQHVKPDRFGYVDPRQQRPQVDVQVSKAQRRAALIVMDRLFKALEARGLRVEVTEGSGYGYGRDAGAGTYAVSENRLDRTRLSLSEEHRKEPHVATAAELRAKERDKYGPAIPKYDSVPTGKLTLSPGGVVDLTDEAALGRVVQKAVADVVAALDRLRAAREEREADQRRERRRLDDESAEKARVEALHKASAAMRRYRDLMDYIAEVRRFGRVPADQRRDGQTLDEWLRWAEWQARCIHPIG